MSRSLPVVALAALALLLAACGAPATAPEGSPSAVPSESAPYSVTRADFTAVRRLMARQATDLLGHDRAGFMATVDRSFAPQARTFYDNVTALGVSSLSYSVADTGVAAAHVPGDDPTFAPEMAEHLKIRGLTSAPVGNVVDATFVRRSGHWLLAAETVDRSTSADDYSRPQWRPWYGRPISIARDGDVMALTDRGSAVPASRLAAIFAADTVHDAAILGVSRRVPVVVDATTNGAGMVMNTLTKERAGASEMPLYATRGTSDAATALAGHTIEADPKAVGQLLRDTVTDRHEVTHLLLHSYGGVPTWVSEGIAEYVAAYPGAVTFNDVDAGFGHLRRMPHVIPNSGVFGLHSATDYAIAHQAVRWLVQTYGMPRFIRLLKTYRRDWKGSADLATPEALRQTYGITTRQLTAGTWREIDRLPR